MLSFASLNDVEDYLVSADYAATEAAEGELADPETSEFWTAVNYSVVNRLMLELATKHPIPIKPRLLVLACCAVAMTVAAMPSTSDPAPA